MCEDWFGDAREGALSKTPSNVEPEESCLASFLSTSTGVGDSFHQYRGGVEVPVAGRHAHMTEIGGDCSNVTSDEVHLVWTGLKSTDSPCVTEIVKARAAASPCLREAQLRDDLVKSVAHQAGPERLSLLAHKDMRIGTADESP
jgi:hypothetical protein